MRKHFLAVLLVVSIIKLQAQTIDLLPSSFITTATDEKHLQYSFLLQNTGTSPTHGYGLKIIFSEDNILDANDVFAVTIPFQDNPTQFIGAIESIPVDNQYVADSFETFHAVYPSPTRGAVYVNSELFSNAPNDTSLRVINGIGSSIADFETTNSGLDAG